MPGSQHDHPKVPKDSYISWWFDAFLKTPRGKAKTKGILKTIRRGK